MPAGKAESHTNIRAMGFLSRKKPKPAPVEIQEEQPIVDELQQMEEALPEPPAAEAPVVDEQPTTAFETVAPEAEEEEEEAALNADEEEGDGRMQAIDLIAPTRLDFLKEKEAAEEEPVKTAE